MTKSRWFQNAESHRRLSGFVERRSPAVVEGQDDHYGECYGGEEGERDEAVKESEAWALGAIGLGRVPGGWGISPVVDFRITHI